MKNMSFRGKSMLGFISVIALFTSIVAFCVFELHQMHRNILTITTDIQPYEMLADQLAFDTVQVQQFLTDVSATHDRDGYSDAEAHAKSFKDGIATLKKRYADQEDQLKSLDALDASFDRYYATGKRMAEAYIANGTDGGNVVMEDFDRDAADITKKMADFRGNVLSTATDVETKAEAAALKASYISIGLALFGIAAGLFLSWRLSINLLNEIGIDPMYARGIAKEIAKGDLSRDITLNPGDNGSLLFAMRSMQLKLREMIHDVTQNAHNIVGAAHHLSDSAQMVLTSSQRQNDAASSVAAAVEEMTASIEQISGNADHSEKIANEAGKFPSKAARL